jgi:hypothetical protein
MVVRGRIYGILGLRTSQITFSNPVVDTLLARSNCFSDYRLTYLVSKNPICVSLWGSLQYHLPMACQAWRPHRFVRNLLSGRQDVPWSQVNQLGVKYYSWDMVLRRDTLGFLPRYICCLSTPARLSAKRFRRNSCRQGCGCDCMYKSLCCR